MPRDVDDTIVAIASAPGGALRGIVRISGPRALDCLQACFRPDPPQPLAVIRLPTAIAGAVQLPSLGTVPADAYLWPTQRSYTRQPSAEVHTLGSPPILDALLAALCQAGARLAKPGEFTMRAFLAGRLDLTQAEAVLAVIDARSQSELDVALAQLAGGLAHPLAQLRDQLLDLLADIEAGLDFADEDIQVISHAEVCRRLRAAGERLNEVMRQVEGRGTSAEPFRIALVGEPNVGKSSLLNALARRTAAVVSDVPGTTRDFITCHMHLGDVPCVLIDTAGVAPVGSEPSIDAAAQRATARQIEQADLQLLCLDASRPLTAWERRQRAASPPAARIVVWTKADLGSCATPGQDEIVTSSKTGFGLQLLLDRMAAELDRLTAATSRAIATTAARCRESLQQADESLRRALELAATQQGDEYVAAELRAALDALGSVVGAVYTEDLLDRIFSRFCIGK